MRRGTRHVAIGVGRRSLNRALARQIAAIDLWAHGHLGFPATLTGLSDRVRLANPETDRSAHVTDVVNTLTSEDLGDLVLAGHGYAA